MEIINDVTVIVVRNGHGNPNLNPGLKAVCILHSANTFQKGIDPTNLPPAMGK